MQKFLIILLLVFLQSCAKEAISNFALDELGAVTLDGQPIQLSSIDADRIALNIYSPTCVPCVKEIPALNLLYDEFKQGRSVALYMAVDPYSIVEEAGDFPEQEMIQKAIAIMIKEKTSRNIQLPVLVMKKPFSINPEGLVSGTPETLLLQTRPIVLYYNFIGAISEQTDPQKIKSDYKIAFFKKMLGY